MTIKLNLLARSIWLAAFLMITLPLTNRAFGDPPVGAPAAATIASAAPEQISDWALAGIVWSDASLTKKLAAEALRQQPTEQNREGLRRLVAESTRMIQSLEQFGWRQVGSAEQLSARASASARSGRAAIPDSPQATSGRNAPAAVEEATGLGPEPELERFGVEDYVDETAREARNPLDAREDGVEAAIAAAAPAGDIPGPQAGAGRISQREVQTRSTTLPYSSDSIYDADDYDPNVDYQVDNPLAAKSVNPRTTDLLDDDRDVSVGDDVTEAASEPQAAVVRPAETANPLVARTQPASTRLDRYTGDGEKHQQDAAWVQLRLEENQLRYSSLVARKDLHNSALQALQQLQTTVRIAGRSTNNESLKSVLAPVLKLQLK